MDIINLNKRILSGYSKFREESVHMTKMKDTKENRKHDGKFRKKHINHDPAAESARATFGEPRVNDDNPRDFKI